MDELMECPFCGESIRAVARICKHCHIDLETANRDQKGTFVPVRLKVNAKVYSGRIFVPDYMSRLSDVINDKRPFAILSSAKEETGTGEIPIGSLAVNKTQIDWVELKPEEVRADAGARSHIIEWK
jgi:hypothetical protein